MFRGAFRIGSVGGVDIRVDPSWTAFAALVAVQFGAVFALRYDHPLPGAAALAVVATGLFFGSVLAHELGHALEARYHGVPVGAITLFLFGGVTELTGETRRPRDDLAVSAIGPYVSVVLAALFGLVVAGMVTLSGRGWPGLAVVAQVAGLLAWLNLGLALFNLLPGAPLDGGRVLRALLWRLTGDRRRAGRGAARAGQLLGLLLLLYGLIRVVSAALDARLALGAGWLTVIGAVVAYAATVEHLHSRDPEPGGGPVAAQTPAP